MQDVVWCWERYKVALRKLLKHDVDLELKDGRIVATAKIGRSVIDISVDRSHPKEATVDDLATLRCVETLIERLPSPSKEIIFYYYIDHSWHKASIRDFEPEKFFETVTLDAVMKKLGLPLNNKRYYWAKAVALAIQEMEGIPECALCSRRRG